MGDKRNSHDSEYDQEDSEDDQQFEENVSNPQNVEEFEEMRFRGDCSDDGVETDEELASLKGSETEEDEDGNPLPIAAWRGIKLKSWNRRVDLKNPRFVVGLCFPNSKQLKEAIREYGLVSTRGIWFQKNTAKKIEVKCQWGCDFWLYASGIANLGPNTVVIKTLKSEHKCSHIHSSHHLNYNRVAQEVQQDLLVDEDWSRKGIQNHIQKKFNLDVNVQTISRGKNKAKRMNEGHYVEQYNKLASYKKELLRSNPGSTVEIKTEMVGDVRRFHRMYVCLPACKKGWKDGCRPLIGLDGCHIKGHHPGQLLCAVGIDANNGMFPIAYAIAEVENTDSWRWFLRYLMWDLRIERDSAYTFITDKQKGLGIAIAELFPNAEHRHCVRHMYNNFKAKHPGEGLKQLVWDAARSTIIPARDKPILTMLEKIRMDLMVRMANRRVAVRGWKDMVGPRIKKIMDKVAERTSCYRAWSSGEFEFQITGGGDNGSKHAVDLRLHTCTCRRWQLSGIPCVHAICAIRSKKAEPALFCDDYLMPSSYMEAYSPIIHPIAGMAPKVSASKGNTSLKDQLIKSRKAWKKRKTMEGSQGVNAGPSSSQTRHAPPTQSSQNPAAKKAQQKGQTESEWAGF
ncbi:uncharacterized protein LOC133716677 [Rosa rugosa]|uniref:uncharacterized protein LOC133716677 n=1 Tax=Rosa rugosa TaxID=74645 RepID=UPI002B40EB46|nr:uncharacterized protein LOC133716677 [Rosa rugosa]